MKIIVYNLVISDVLVEHVIQKTKGTQDSKNSGKVSPTKKTNKKQKSTDNL